MGKAILLRFFRREMRQGKVDDRMARLGRSRTPCGAFTLVEMVLSVGIISFAFVSLLGMTAVGVTTFQKSMDTDVGTQIMQRIVEDSQQSSYATLIATPTTTRYFDDQGNEVSSLNLSVYTAQVIVTSSTQLPNTVTPASSNLATITVKLANNPGRNPSPFTGNIPYTVHSALIAKSQ